MLLQHHALAEMRNEVLEARREATEASSGRESERKARVLLQHRLSRIADGTEREAWQEERAALVEAHLMSKAEILEAALRHQRELQQEHLEKRAATINNALLLESELQAEREKCAAQTADNAARKARLEYLESSVNRNNRRDASHFEEMLAVQAKHHEEAIEKLQEALRGARSHANAQVGSSLLFIIQRGY